MSWADDAFGNITGHFFTVPQLGAGTMYADHAACGDCAAEWGRVLAAASRRRVCPVCGADAAEAGAAEDPPPTAAA